MEHKAEISIHNRFDVFVRDANTNEVIKQGQAENVVLNRIYERILNFSSYFDKIAYGDGTSETAPTATRETLFNQIGYKTGVQEELTRAYPTSKWVKKITLGTGEENGKTITELGIADTSSTTKVNTHALITDAQGQPLDLGEKTSLQIIDIYATIFVTMYDVDWGLYWYADGLRDYLTGTGSAGLQLGISNLEGAELATINGTKTIDTTNKTMTLSGRFNVDSLNKDVRFLYWTSGGLLCEVPRPNVFTGTQITDLVIGAGDGVNKVFSIGRNEGTPIEDLAIKVDGSPVSYTYDVSNYVTLDTAPDEDASVTASYKSKYFPKTSDNVIDATFKIGFGLNKPSAVMPDKPAVIPGASTPIAGDSTYGFYGEVPQNDLISGGFLALRLGLTSGTIQNTTEPWLKFALDGKILFVAKKTFRYNVSWDNINARDAVYGNRTIKINGKTYKIRLMRGADPKFDVMTPIKDQTGGGDGYSGNICYYSEWNKLMLPIHIQAKDSSWAYPNNVEAGIPYWGIDYTDLDLNVKSGTGSNNGYYTWCQEMTSDSTNRMGRGSNGVSFSGYDISNKTRANYGWRPVLELVP